MLLGPPQTNIKPPQTNILSIDYLSSITNLKYWGSSEPIITKTLGLLSDLSVGYSSVRKLVKLDAVQFMLNNHTVSLRSSFPDHNSHKSSNASWLCLTPCTDVMVCLRSIYSNASLKLIIGPVLHSPQQVGGLGSFSFSHRTLSSK